MPKQSSYPCPDPSCPKSFTTARAMKIHYTWKHNPRKR